MAHDFRLSGNIYISKAGSTDTIGTSPDAPQVGLTGQEVNAAIILGTGVYQWPTVFSGGRQGYYGIYPQADGRVVLLGDGQSRFQFMASDGCLFAGLRFEQFMGFQFGHNPSNPPTYRRCEFRALPPGAGQPAQANSGAIGSCTFEDCVFQHVHFSARDFLNSQGGNMYESTFTRCLFFDCTFDSPARSMVNCYVDATTAAWALAATGTNVDPRADVSQGYGLRLDQAPAALQIPHNISKDPLFNSLENNEFSVRAGSPHLPTDIGPRQYRQGRAFVVQAPATGQAAEAGNTSFAPVGGGAAVGLLGTTNVLEATGAGALIIRPDATPDGTARLRTDRIQHSDKLPRELSYMQVLGGDNFNTSYPALASQLNAHAPEVFNNNVPDLSAYASGEAGRNPNRLSYRLRWSTLPDPRLDHPEDWVTGADMVECEWNARPLYNPVTGIGNGRAEFVVADGRPIICTWYQLEIGLTNLYYH